jgi:hypothetical protein
MDQGKRVNNDPVPTYHIKRVTERSDMDICCPVLFYENVKFALRIMGLQTLRAFNVSLTKRRMLQQLPEIISVPARGKYRVERLHIQQLVISTVEIYLDKQCPWVLLYNPRT